MLLLQVHGLDAETWKKVDVVYIDIADRHQVEPKVKFLLRKNVEVHEQKHYNPLSSSAQDYKPEEDPCRFKSVKTGRGPLGPDWKVQYCKTDLLIRGWILILQYFLYPYSTDVLIIH